MTTQTLTLTDFVLARIDEDETAIRAGGHAWVEISDYMLRELRPGAPIVFTEERMLAECAAKRLLLTIHDWTPVEKYACQHEAPVTRYICGQCGGAPDDPCDTLRALASVYAEHEDYRQEWRAQG